MRGRAGGRRAGKSLFRSRSRQTDDIVRRRSFTFLMGSLPGRALVLRQSKDISSGSRIVASCLGVDPQQPLMYYERRNNSREPLYVIDGRAVASSFGVYAKRALDELQRAYPFSFNDIARFYFHQVNGKVLMKPSACPRSASRCISSDTATLLPQRPSCFWMKIARMASSSMAIS